MSKLNAKGQCPVCLVKPLTYKRDQKYFCTKCARSYSLLTGEFISSSLWQSFNEKSELSKRADHAMYLVDIIDEARAKSDPSTSRRIILDLIAAEQAEATRNGYLRALADLKKHLDLFSNGHTTVNLDSLYKYIADAKAHRKGEE